jgi:Histidine kinase-, DNA gyrase B-, and HSP90-like ATPase
VYDDRQFRFRVRDDGKGIDPALLSDEGREGHYGLRGMRERATLIGGRLTIWSKVDTGSEVELGVFRQRRLRRRSNAVTVVPKARREEMNRREARGPCDQPATAGLAPEHAHGESLRHPTAGQMAWTVSRGPARK